MNPARAAVCLLVGTCFLATLHGAAEPKPEPATPSVPTVIESEGPADVVSTATESTFTIRDKVVVTATNLKMNCDLLVVVSRRTGDSAATLGKQQSFKSLVATGNVRILQNDREATCDRAEIFPGEDKVVLTGNFKVRALDNSFTQTGGEGTLYRGERRAVITGRPTITLPPLKDLGYEKEKPKEKAKDGEKTAPPTPPPPAATPPSITVPGLTPQPK